MTAPPPLATAPTGLVADLRVPDRLRATFEAAPGEVVAVIGPNGAGKSTLLHALAGLVEVEGSALLGDSDLLRLPVRERGVGLVFQGQMLFPHLSAVDNVAFGPRSRGVGRKEAATVARAWLARFSIDDLAERKPDQLSGGQAQRVAIARALATDPQILLLDEPFTGLDVSVQMTLRVELGRHLREFAGIALVVTHDPIDALTLADTVLVLDEGTVAQIGAPADVAAHPRTTHVARLVGLNLVTDGDELITFTPDAVVVSLSEPQGSSRLRWRGTVATLAPHGDAVRVLVHSGPHLLADVTPAAAAELELVPGRDVWLSVKSTAVSRHSAR